MSGLPLLNPSALIDLIASDADALNRLRSLVAVPTQPVDAAPFMRPDEAAEYLRCTRKRIYDLVSSGRLKRYGEGRRLLLRRSEVEALALSSDP